MKLFVYGLLKKGLSLHYYLNDSKFIGNYTLNKHKVEVYNDAYYFIEYTGKPEDIVSGEVYEITEEKKIQLDIVENHFKFKAVPNLPELNYYIIES